MLTRRHLLLGFGVAPLAATSVHCSRAKSQTPHWPRTSQHEGIEMIDLFPNDADEKSPLVVAIHGMGDRPERWIDDYRRFPARVHIALPRAFDPYGEGYAWFRFEDGMTDEQFGAVVGNAEERLWRGIASLAGTRRVIVTGFSQGGILSFAIAARHPKEIVCALPVAGSCPGPLLPQEGSPAAPVVAFHGTADRMIDVKWARESVHAWKERGATAELHEYEGVAHTISPRMRADLWASIRQALPSS